MAEIIEFYHPTPRLPSRDQISPKAPAEAPAPQHEAPEISAEFLHEAIKAKLPNIEDMVIVMKYKDGTTGFLGNTVDIANALLLLRKIEFECMTIMKDGLPPTRPLTTA